MLASFPELLSAAIIRLVDEDSREEGSQDRLQVCSLHDRKPWLQSAEQHQQDAASKPGML